MLGSVNRVEMASTSQIQSGSVKQQEEREFWRDDINMNSSNMGKTLATTYHKAASALNKNSNSEREYKYGYYDDKEKAWIITKDNQEWKSQYETLQRGFDAIIKDPMVTEDEKALALFGQKMKGGKPGDKKEAAEVRYVVMDAISNGLDGTPGKVIAQIACDVFKIAPCSENLQSGFDAIISNDKTTEDEKALALLGKSMGELNISEDLARELFYDATEDAAKASNVVMNAIANPLQGWMGQLLFGNIRNGIDGFLENKIAGASWLAANSVYDKNWEFQSQILMAGFKAIAENPDSSETGKKLAQQGINLGTNENITHDAFIKSGNSIMQDILRL